MREDADLQITTLGTSHGDATYERFNSVTLYEANGAAYLVDAGAPVNALLVRQQKPLHNLKAVFITHMHDDHVGGVPGLVKSLIKHAVPGQHTTVFLPEARALPALRDWLAVQHIDVEDSCVSLAVVEPGFAYDDGTLRVTAVPTQHLPAEPPITFAFLLEGAGRTVLHTGDLAADFSDFPREAAQGADACVCEATHFPPAVAVPVLQHCSLGRLILNHVHDPWHGPGEAKLLEHYASLPYPVAVAHDGDVYRV